MILPVLVQLLVQLKQRASICTGSACRLERALEELGGYRTAAGQSTTPDFNEEDRLRADLHQSEAQKRQLGQDSQALANLVLDLSQRQETFHQATSSQGKMWSHMYIDITLAECQEMQTLWVTRSAILPPLWHMLNATAAAFVTLRAIQPARNMPKFPKFPFQCFDKLASKFVQQNWQCYLHAHFVTLNACLLTRHGVLQITEAR